MTDTPKVLDLREAEALALDAAEGNAEAARALVEVLWPTWLRLVRATPALRVLKAGDDDIANIMVRLVEKVQSPRTLALYPPWREQNQDKDFGDWLRIVTANTVRDYVKACTRQPRLETGGVEPESRKRMLNEFIRSTGTNPLSFRPPVTANETARELIEFATLHLKGDQLQALRLWLHGASVEELADELSRSTDSARKLLRAAIARLRREFSSTKRH